MKTPTEKKFRFFVGIDVSRDFFDATIMHGKVVITHQKVENSETAIKGFISELKTIKGFRLCFCVFGMEHTGIYCNFLLTTLEKKRANIVHENSLVIRNSLGLIRGKNDKVDSARIAGYLYKCRDQLSLWHSKRDIIGKLCILDSLRNKLASQIKALKQTEKEISCFLDKKTSLLRSNNCAGTVLAMNKDIEEIDNTIRSFIQKDDRISRLMEWITSVPNIGEKTALQIVIKTNEFRDISDPKKFACFAGIAPFPYESGKSVKQKTRVSHLSDGKMKSMLHLCAMGSLRSNPELLAYFKRKTETDGKNGMLVLNVIRYKLVLRIFACVKGERMFRNDYQPKAIEPDNDPATNNEPDQVYEKTLVLSD
ncbi:transposase [Pedobacter jeongneungensis]